MLSRAHNTALRFYNESHLANIYLNIHPFELDINQINTERYYTIGNIFNAQIYTRSRHMGIPFYRSFDYYTVLVSLLTNPAYYYSFFSSETLRKIFWDPIWFDDSIEVMKRIRNYMLENKGQSINDAINILKGTKLKCNALNKVFNYLK